MSALPSLSLLIAALSGAVAALLLRSGLRLAAKTWVSRTPLATYDCSVDLDGKPGVLWHAWGCRVTDPDATDRQAWEHTDQQRSAREHTIYGPYANDFGKPGFYKITFRVFGLGFGRSIEPVIVLDVVQAPFGGRTDYVLLGQRIVKARELNGSYKDFSVFCYATGSGVYEYRCRVLPSAYRPDQHTIRFDAVKVYFHLPIWEVI